MKVARTSAFFLATILFTVLFAFTLTSAKHQNALFSRVSEPHKSPISDIPSQSSISITVEDSQNTFLANGMASFFTHIITTNNNNKSNTTGSTTDSTINELLLSLIPEQKSTTLFQLTSFHIDLRYFYSNQQLSTNYDIPTPITSIDNIKITINEEVRVGEDLWLEVFITYDDMSSTNQLHQHFFNNKQNRTTITFTQTLSLLPLQDTTSNISTTFKSIYIRPEDIFMDIIKTSAPKAPMQSTTDNMFLHPEVLFGNFNASIFSQQSSLFKAVKYLQLTPVGRYEFPTPANNTLRYNYNTHHKSNANNNNVIKKVQQQQSSQQQGNPSCLLNQIQVTGQYIVNTNQNNRIALILPFTDEIKNDLTDGGVLSLFCPGDTLYLQPIGLADKSSQFDVSTFSKTFNNTQYLTLDLLTELSSASLLTTSKTTTTSTKSTFGNIHQYKQNKLSMMTTTKKQLANGKGSNNNNNNILYSNLIPFKAINDWRQPFFNPLSMHDASNKLIYFRSDVYHNNYERFTIDDSIMFIFTGIESISDNTAAPPTASIEIYDGDNRIIVSYSDIPIIKYSNDNKTNNINIKKIASAYNLQNFNGYYTVQLPLLNPTTQPPFDGTLLSVNAAFSTIGMKFHHNNLKNVQVTMIYNHMWPIQDQSGIGNFYFTTTRPI